jgi:hypothetical protein
MNILHLSPLLPSRGGCGGKQAICNHLQDISDLGHDVWLVAVDIEGVGQLDPLIPASAKCLIFSVGYTSRHGIACLFSRLLSNLLGLSAPGSRCRGFTCRDLISHEPQPRPESGVRA